MLDNLHFVFFLTNLALWAVTGLLFSYALLQNKKIRKVAKKIVLSAVFGALFGGSLGFLANGLPDFSSSVQNITIAGVFSAIGTLAFIPRREKKIKKIK